ncbi:hypothetical protein [uncultured Corynebacterium sp.]|uniref:hypothetical protein n=1 Tax=uncultured Corynebacterium sp. TaxID=159447 RepID=UPI0025EDD16A|nr:hypothetical protein [uncultured Corynebacterium sp.]
MSLFDSLKTAGTSALGVAKVFGANLKEDRAAHPSEPTASDQSFLERGEAIARDLAGSVRRAAESTAGTEEFASAKNDVTVAFNEARDEVSNRVNQGKNADKPAQDPSSPYGQGAGAAGAADAAGAAAANDETTIVDGEVVETDATDSMTTTDQENQN